MREVQKAIRKNEKGLCVIAGDISPIDVVSHFACLCEEKGLPYIYVPSKLELGAAASTKRPTSVLMVVPAKDWERQEDYDELEQRIKSEMPKF